MRTVTIFLIVSLICALALAEDVKTDWQVIFEDNFSDNGNHWPVFKNDRAVVEIKNGKYIFEHKEPKDGWILWREIKIDQNRDFEIEALIEQTTCVSPNCDFGISWGVNGEGYDNYKFGIAESFHYFYGKMTGRTWDFIIFPTQSTHIRKQNSIDKLKIKKIGKQVMFYINDQYVNKAQFEDFFGNNVGFSFYGLVKVEIDRLVVKQYFPDPDRSSGPNRTAEGATVIPLNATDPNGKIDYDQGDRTDWYQVEVPEKGILSFHVQQENSGTLLYVELYDKPEGQKQRGNLPVKRFTVYGEIRESASIENAKPGTY